jgi:hypothetical protein
MKLEQLTVAYKYHVATPVAIKSWSGFIKTIEDKYDTFIALKSELHVSPFYSYKGQLYLQFVFDFDGVKAFEEAKQFCRKEIIRNKLSLNDWFVELTGTSVHVVSRSIYGPISERDIKRIRDYVYKRLGRYYISLDIPTTIRNLPVRRCLSLSSNKKFMVLPFRIPTFLSKGKNELEKIISQTDITKSVFHNILTQYTLPTNIKSLSDAPFRLKDALKRDVVPEEIKKKKIVTPSEPEVEIHEQPEDVGREF